MADIAGLVLSIGPIFVSSSVWLRRQLQTTRTNRETFATALELIGKVRELVDVISTKLRASTEDIPDEQLHEFCVKLQGLKGEADELQHMLQDLQPFAANEASDVTPLRARVIRVREFVQAGPRDRELSQRFEQVNSLLDRTNGLTEELRNCLQLEVIHSSIDRVGQPEGQQCDVFVPYFHTWASPRRPELDFVIDRVQPSPEARVKQWLLQSKTTSSCRAYAMVGMTGLGKTTVMHALAEDEDIIECFPGGIYFLEIGQGADEASVIKQLAISVRLSGGTEAADEVQGASSLAEAVCLTSLWFQTRSSLFLVDDVCAGRHGGILTHLLQLQAKCEESAVLLSTRDQAVAGEVSFIRFSSMSETGLKSREIFMRHAAQHGEEAPCLSEAREPALKRILEKCAGVPLTLAIAGRAVNTLWNGTRSFESALVWYEKSLQKRTRLVGDGKHMTHPNFFSATRTSLALLDAWYLERTNGDDGPKLAHLFSRLCVIPRKTSVVQYVIYMLWPELDEIEVVAVLDRLVELNLVVCDGERDGVMSFQLHNLILEYCEDAARKHNEFVAFFRNLLRGYETLLPVHQRPAEASASLHQQRPWWLIDPSVDGGFLIRNVADFLYKGRLQEELVDLVSHAGWTVKRLKHDGIVALMQDFNLSVKAVESSSHLCSKRHDLKRLRDVVSDMSRHVLHSPCELAPQSSARISVLNEGDEVAQRFLSSSGEITTGAWLQAQTSHWPGPYGARMVEIPVFDKVLDIGANWEKNMIFAATERTLFEVDLKIRRIVKAWYFPDEYHIFHSMTADGRFLCFEGSNRSLAVWDRQINHVIWRAEGFLDDDVESVAWSSDNTVLVIGSASGSLLVLSKADGRLLRQIPHAHNSAICALSVGGEYSLVASQGRDGDVKVWDIALGDLHRRVPWTSGARSPTLSSDSQVLLVPGPDHRLHKLHLEGGDAAAVVQTDCTTAVALSENRIMLHGTLEGFLVWNDFDTGQRLRTMYAPLHALDVIVASPDARYAISAGRDHVIRFWDSKGPDVLTDFVQGHSDAVACVALNEMIGEITSIGGGSLKTWEPRTRSLAPTSSCLLQESNNQTSVLSRDGSLAATSFGRNISIRKTGVTLGLGRQHERRIIAMALSGNGRRLVSISLDGVVNVHDTETGVLIQTIYVHESEQCLTPCIATCGEGYHVVLKLADCMLRCDTSRDYAFERIPESDTISAVALSGDGQWLVTGNKNGGIQVKSWTSRTVLWQKTHAHDDAVVCLDVNMSANQIVSAGRDRMLKVWRYCASPPPTHGEVTRPGTFGDVHVVSLSSISPGYFAQLAQVVLPEMPRCLASCAYVEAREQWYVVGDERGNVIVHKLEGSAIFHDSEFHTECLSGGADHLAPTVHLQTMNLSTRPTRSRAVG